MCGTCDGKRWGIDDIDKAAAEGFLANVRIPWQTAIIKLELPYGTTTGTM